MRVQLFTVMAVALFATALWAAPTSPPVSPPTPPPASPPASPANKASAPIRTLAKTRPGSVLKGDTLLPGRLDLRSETERRRDSELRSHFSRLAELDVVAAIATDKGDTQLAERVEQVRRKEVQRHQKIMMTLKREFFDARALASGANQ